MPLSLSKPRYPRLATAVSLARMGTDEITLPPLGKGALRLTVKLALVLVAAYGIHLLMDWAMVQASETGSKNLMFGMLATLLVAYALLIAVPFMPGVEIGISLLILQGAAIAPFVYAATVFGLLIAYLAGRFLPYRWLHGILADLRLKKACALVDRLAPMSGRERLSHLSERAPRWLRPLVGPWRYLMLAALINLPGTTVIGGGGGIAMTAGFSRLFQPAATALTLALAVMPIPLVVWVTGSTDLLP
ncbi:MAG: hypothetical protein AAFY31_06160 [Pseudomonadota bacterium]